MPSRIPDDKRAAILADIKAGEKSRGQIAREQGVSPQTVTNLARDASILEPFSRLKTKNAIEAARVDGRARRAALAQRLLDKADSCLDLMDRPYAVFAFAGRDGDYREHERDRPPPAELRNLMVSAATALDKHMALDRHDSSDPGEVASLLGSLLGGLQAKHGDGNGDSNGDGA